MEVPGDDIGPVALRLEEGHGITDTRPEELGAGTDLEGRRRGLHRAADGDSVRSRIVDCRQVQPMDGRVGVVPVAVVGSDRAGHHRGAGVVDHRERRALRGRRGEQVGDLGLVGQVAQLVDADDAVDRRGDARERWRWARRSHCGVGLGVVVAAAALLGEGVALAVGRRAVIDTTRAIATTATTRPTTIVRFRDARSIGVNLSSGGLTRRRRTQSRGLFMTGTGFRPDDPLDRQIRDHRTAQATVTVLRDDGQPLARQEVVIGQRSHAFRFGCTGAELIALANDEVAETDRDAAERRAAHWLELFDFATLPFYWGKFEPVRGHPDTRRLMTAAHWLVDRGCLVKGHPLCWHTETADWLLDLSTPDAIAAQLARIEREVSGFAGVIDRWDVLNEVVIMPVFDKYDNGVTRMCRELGQVGIVRTMVDAARAANPGATLLLNDFDVSPAYERLIEDCLDAGIVIDVLGIQSHMHQGYWGEAKTLDVLERFARFGLPIHFTENTLVSGQIMPPEIVDLNDYQVAEWPTTPDGEARQADEVTRHYKTLLSHPAVTAITWWGIDDGGWLKAPTGLLRVDGSTKPAYEALRGLIKGEWWLAPTTMVTDEAGKLAVDGFLGEYGVTWSGQAAKFGLSEPGATTVEARLGRT